MGNTCPSRAQLSVGVNERDPIRADACSGSVELRRGSLTGPRSASGPALTVNVRAYRPPPRNERSHDGREHLRVPALVSRHGDSKQWPGLGCSSRAATAIDRSPWSAMSGRLHSQSWQPISGGFTHRRSLGSILVPRRSCRTSGSRRQAQTTTRRIPPEPLLGSAPSAVRRARPAPATAIR